MNYLFFKNIHTLLALLTISGFVIRGYWMMTNSGRLQQRMTRIAPHILDSVFLGSGIALLMLLSLNPLSHSWLLAKFAGLIVYILLGSVAIRRGSTHQVRRLSFVAALSAFAYVVGVAVSKSPVSWLAYLS
ncbi:MAG: SirB2 family protein [Gammaproteobacteria bacterium]|nr:SirB2 family protein [Gammaproteobacteria bacterium]MBT8111886.1 SirB2 family protein [Gammaproteobacteria bacterium]NND46921.1 SirB2 family protein [Woeseiaceae bacterium]NNL46585.1 SirB2 family protein [Woeseiaceae bacterium]